MDDRIAEAERDIADHTECLQGTCSMTALADTRTYALQQDFIRVDRVEVGSNREIEKVSRDYVANIYGSDWRTETGSPQRWYMEDIRQVGLHPAPTGGLVTSGSAILCYGPIYPRAMSADSGAGGTTRIPTALQNAIVYYVSREAAARDAEPGGPMEGKVGAFDARYQAEIARYKHVRPTVLTIAAPRQT